MRTAWESAARAACGLENDYGSASYWLSCSRFLWVMQTNTILQRVPSVCGWIVVCLLGFSSLRVASVPD